jgi:hypothetical protein
VNEKFHIYPLGPSAFPLALIKGHHKYVQWRKEEQIMEFGVPVCMGFSPFWTFVP